MTVAPCLVLRHTAPDGASTRPTVFLDRDGVIIENRVSHVRSRSDVALIRGAGEAVRRLHTGNDVVVVTNQAIVGRGQCSVDDVVDVHHFVVDLLRQCGATVVGSLICPHAPADGCACRKPEPGMLRTAATVWGCRLETSWLVGDAVTDIQAGRAVGARTMLVRTGRGRAHEDEVRQRFPDCLVTESIVTGTETILAGPALT